MFTQTIYDVKTQTHTEAVARIIVQAYEESKAVYDFVLKRALSNYQDFLDTHITLEVPAVKFVLHNTQTATQSTCSYENSDAIEMLKNALKDACCSLLQDDEEAERKTKEILLDVRRALA